MTWKFIYTMNRNVWLAHCCSDTSADVRQTDLSDKTGHLFNQVALQSNRDSIQSSLIFWGFHFRIVFD